MCDIECVFESMTGRGSIFISNLAAAQNLPLLQGNIYAIQPRVSRLSSLLHAVDFYSTASRPSLSTSTSLPKIMKSTPLSVTSDRLMTSSRLPGSRQTS